MHSTETPSPTMLIILDGFGYREELEDNAIKIANMTNWQEWLSNYPNTLLKSSGQEVGLPDGYMGNSEVGHLTIGAGRIVKSVLSKFHEEIDNGNFFHHKILLKNLSTLKESGKALHIIGLLSDAGVHSHEKHFYALIKLANKVGIKKIFVHPFLDGRDTPPKSAPKYLFKLESICKKYNATISSIHGRFYAMDRDQNWERTKLSYETLTHNQAEKECSWNEALKEAYKEETDEFIKPRRLTQKGVIEDGDGVIFMNFRPDRASQLAECFLNPNFNHFEKTNSPKISFFISTTRYKKEFQNDVLFEEELVLDTLLDILAQHNKKLLIIAETEKYAHVTYFFRGMRDEKTPNEERVLVPSLKLKNYIEHPEMSAPEITKTILKSLQENPKEFYLVNYANADMVGHAGNLNATIKACECLDRELGKLYEEVVEKQNGTLFITADHGNAEENLTHHTTNPVPFAVINKGMQNCKIAGKQSFGLKNIAPTVLKYLGIEIPSDMSKEIVL